MPFRHFDPALFEFLQQLEENNHRDWFQENKQRFEDEVQSPMLELIETMRPKLAKISPNLIVEAKKSGGSLSRIYRDTRFSKDPTPYHTFLVAKFTPAAGKKSCAAGFFFRVSGDHAGIGCGIRGADSSGLRLIRTAIDTQPQVYLACRDDPKLTKRFEPLSGESLKRPPQGFDATHPLIDDLKRKEFFVVRRFSIRQMISENVPRLLDESFKAAAPLIGFFNRAVGVAF